MQRDVKGMADGTRVYGCGATVEKVVNYLDIRMTTAPRMHRL